MWVCSDEWESLWVTPVPLQQTRFLTWGTSPGSALVSLHLQRVEKMYRNSAVVYGFVFLSSVICGTSLTQGCSASVCSQTRDPDTITWSHGVRRWERSLSSPLYIRRKIYYINRSFSKVSTTCRTCCCRIRNLGIYHSFFNLVML